MLKEAPQDVILKVQQKLLDKGLTAFDHEDQLERMQSEQVLLQV